MATAGKKRGSDKAGVVRPQTLTPDGGGVREQKAVSPPVDEDNAFVNVTNAEELGNPEQHDAEDTNARQAVRDARTELSARYRPHPDADLVKSYDKNKK